MGKNKHRNKKSTKQKTENLPRKKSVDDKTQIKQEEKIIQKDPADNNDGKISKSPQQQIVTNGVEKKTNDGEKTNNSQNKPEPDKKKADAQEQKSEGVTENKIDSTDQKKASSTDEKKADSTDQKEVNTTDQKDVNSTDQKKTSEENKSDPTEKIPEESEEKNDSKENNPVEVAPVEEKKCNEVPDTKHKNTKQNKTQKERVFDERISKHEQFISPQKWYIDVKTDSIAPSHCTNCDATINLGDIHLYSYGLLLLPSLDKVVKTKLRFCTTSKCITNIKGNNHNIRDIPDEMKVIQGPSVIMTVEEENALKEQSFVIVKSWHMGLSELQPFYYEADPNDDKPNSEPTTPVIKPDEVTTPDPAPAPATIPDDVPAVKPRSPVKIPEIDYDGTDAETKAALKEQLINTINRSPIKKPTSTPTKTLPTKDTTPISSKETESKPNDTTKTTITTTAGTNETRNSEGSNKSSKKSRKSSKPGKTVKSSKDKDKGSAKEDGDGDKQSGGV